MNIYVGNLSLDVTEEELRQEFIAFGEVVSVTIMNNHYIGSGQPRGYGFVEMLSRSEGQAAVTSLHGTTLRHRMIDVIQALPLSDRGDGTYHNCRRGSGYSGGARRGRS
ncbi:RNA recognition motif domain-containing protein [Chloroflexota bacterium]